MFVGLQENLIEEQLDRFGFVDIKFLKIQN